MSAPFLGPDGSSGRAGAVSEPAILAFFRILADAPDGDTVAAAVGRGMLAAYDPELATIHVVTTDGTEAALVGQFGLEPDLADVYARVPLELPSPLRNVVRSGGEIFISLAQVAADFPIAAAYLEAHPGDARAQAAFLPLRHRGVTMGVLSLRFPQPIQRTWPLRLTLDALVSGLTLWALAHAAEARGPSEERRRSGQLKVSDRQRKVLVLAREGRTNADIARRLGFSEVTIKSDLTGLYRLLGASGRTDLIEKAALAGL